MVVRRTSTGATSLPGDYPDDGRCANALRRLDMYAHAPPEISGFTERTVGGGLFTIVVSLIFIALFTMQVSALFAASYVTDIVVDHTADAKLRVNVRVDFPFVECEFLHLDVVDAIGSRKTNISGENVYKHPLSGPMKYMNIQHAAPVNAETLDDAFEYGTTTDYDHYGNKRIAFDIAGLDMFEHMVRVHHGLLLVNFHAPWCLHCRNFAPIWEHAAEMVRLELRRTGRSRLSLGMASVDCSTEKNDELCSKLHVQAYPSVRVYRAGSLHPSKENQTSIAELHREAENIQFEVYHGKRSAEAIAAFADSLLKEIEAATEDGNDEASPKKRGTVFGHDADGDGRHDSVVRTPGCSVNGQFNVNRVPGAFYFVPRSRSHSLADVDMTHVVRHLSFGEHVPGKPSFIPRHLRKAWSLIPVDMGGRFAKKDNGGGGAQFDARENRRTAFEHYMKVIPRTFAPIDGAPIQIYEYTFSSNHFDVHGSAEEREMIYYDRVEEHAMDDEFRRPRGPVVKFSYDLSPMQVKNSTRKLQNTNHVR